LTILISNLTLNEFFAIVSNTSLPTSPEGKGLGLLGGTIPALALALVPAVVPVTAKSLGMGGRTLLLFETGEYDRGD
jgi:hypothetical protein